MWKKYIQQQQQPLSPFRIFVGAQKTAMFFFLPLFPLPLPLIKMVRFQFVPWGWSQHVCVGILFVWASRDLGTIRYFDLNLNRPWEDGYGYGIRRTTIFTPRASEVKYSPVIKVPVAKSLFVRFETFRKACPWIFWSSVNLARCKCWSSFFNVGFGADNPEWVWLCCTNLGFCEHATLAFVGVRRC